MVELSDRFILQNNFASASELDVRRQMGAVLHPHGEIFSFETVLTKPEFNLRLFSIEVED